MCSDLYGEKITQYANEALFKRIVYKPDLVVQAKGYSCGDELSLRTKLINDKLQYEIENMNCCIIAKSSINFMLSKIQGKSYLEVYDFIKNGSDYYVKLYKSQLDYNDENSTQRDHCIELAWNSINTSLYELQKVNKTLNIKREVESHVFDCDSCISTQVINTKKDKKNNDKTNKKSIKDLIYGIFDIKSKVYKKLNKRLVKACGINAHRLAKIQLSDLEIKSLGKLVDNWDKDFLQYFNKEKLDCILCYNIVNKLHRKLPKELDSLYTSRKLKNEINCKAFEDIKMLLKERQIPFTYIKGIALNKYYESQGMLRFSYDLDILTDNINSYFKIVSLVKYELGFEHYDKLGMACSIKQVDNGILHGHAHFLRIINGKHVNIDVNFPNITNDISKILIGDIQYNSQVCKDYNLMIILISHAFKHSILPIKELNDLYELLVNNNIDKNAFRDNILKNDLMFKCECFRLIMIKMYFMNEESINFMNFNDSLSNKDKLFLKLLFLLGFPFSKLPYRLLQWRSQSKSKKHISNDKSINMEQNDIRFYNTVKKDGSLRVYSIPIISFYQKVTISPEYIKNLEYECFFENCYLVKIDNNKLLITDSYIYAFSESFNLDTDLPKNWVNACGNICNKLNISADNYYYRISYDDITSSWIYS